jgi:sirohydrochlorin ferrochelatase
VAAPIVLAAHGSRDPASAATIGRLTAAVRWRPSSTSTNRRSRMFCTACLPG